MGVKISDLTAASNVADANEFEINESGTSKKVTASQIKSYATNSTSVTAAGALMDSELADVAAVKGINQALTTSSSPTFNGVNTTGDISFGDNDKAIFGAGSDLQIYHDGSNSVISEAGTGDINIQTNGTALSILGSSGSEFMGYFRSGGEVQLFHNNAKKFETTSTGCEITSSDDANGLVVGHNDTDFAVYTDSTIGEIRLKAEDGSGNNFSKFMSFYTQPSGSSAAERMRLTPDGSVGIGTASPSSYGTLAVAGTLATVPDNNGYALFAGRYSAGYPNATLNSIDGVPWVIQQGGTERMRLTSTGLGVGTSSPSSAIHAVGGAGTNIAIQSTAGSHWRLGDAVGASNGTFVLYDYTNSAARLTVNSSGNVGIGTNSPINHNANATTLHVDGGAYGSEIRLTNNTTGVASGNGFHLVAIGTSAYIWQNEVAPLIIATSSTERMRIDSSGNVGIGTSSPQATAEISGGLDNRLRINSTDGTTSNNYGIDFSTAGTVRGGIRYNAGNNYLAFYGYDNTERLRIDSNGALNGPPSANFDIKTGSGTGDMRFFTNGSQRAMVGADGNLFVGTTGYLVAGAKVRASSVAATFEGEVTHASGSGAVFLANRTSSDGWVAAWYRGGSSVGSISVTSSATSYNTSSDYRLKENVTDVTDGITRVKQLEPKRFNFIVDADTTVDGFLAHEVQSVVPEAITGTHNEVDDDGNPVYQGIDQAKLVPLLTAALQEAIAKIETLETKVAALEGA